MQFTSKRIRAGFILVPFFIVLGSYSIHQADADPGGVFGDSKSGCGGNNCHGSKSTETSVTITTDSPQIVTGQTYVFQIAVSNASEAKGGCDISVDKGKLAVNGTGSSALRLVGTELTHPSPKVFSNDTAFWKFKYTAPTTPGTYHIYAAGNAVNGNGTNDAGDHWNTTVYTVTVVSPSGPVITAPALFRDTVITHGSHTKTLWVKNSGVSVLTINKYSLHSSTSFQIADSSARSIPASDSVAVKITFAPIKPGAVTDTLHLYTDDGATPISSTILTGLATAGVFQVSSNPVKFGTVEVTKMDTVSITLKNTGNAVLTITPSTGTNPDFTFIGISPPAAPPFTIPPQTTVTATFQFAPGRVGGDTSEFLITIAEYPGADHDTTIKLIGEGTSNSDVKNHSSNDNSFQVLGNPTSGLLRIRSSIGGSIAVRIADIGGRSVFSQELESQPEFMLDVNVLPTGAYFLQIEQSDGEIFEQRIVIVR